MVILFVSFIDQITKNFATGYFSYICNRGVAFGFGQSGLLFSLLAVTVILWLFVREKNKWQKLFLVIILAAGISNLLDRLFFGCVRDFINISFIPTFNIADAVITLGLIFLILNMLLRSKNET